MMLLGDSPFGMRTLRVSLWDDGVELRGFMLRWWELDRGRNSESHLNSDASSVNGRSGEAHAVTLGHDPVSDMATGSKP